MLYFNLISFFFDEDSRKILKEDTQIEGPVPICNKVITK
jgi:hypothetical protein